MRVPRLAIVVILISVACTRGWAPGDVTSARPRGASRPAQSERGLRLQISSASMDAGSCLTGTVTTVDRGLVAARLDVVGSDGPSVSVDVSGGRGTARICAGWTGTDVVLLRLSAPGSGPATVSVPLRIRSQPWMVRVQRLVGAAPVSVSVGGGAATTIYSHLGTVPRTPASNEKLLLSMALLDRFGTGYRIPTEVIGAPIRASTVPGDLWLTGHGDPELGSAGLLRLASRLRDLGVRRVRGSVVGVTGTFRRDRDAPGWRRIALRYVGLPTALMFQRNVGTDGFVFDPERRAAAALTSDLRRLGVRVEGRARAATGPAEGKVLARIGSAPLADILRRQNMRSVNLFAEVLDKLLGAAAVGPPGSIAEGALAIQSWASSHGVAVVAHDASGLSNADRITTDGMISLLRTAAASSWGPALRATLPTPGEGTLARRLDGVRVRAKTGTLFMGISALSGWVWLRRSRRWEAFSVLSRGLRKGRAVALEDRIVRILSDA